MFYYIPEHPLLEPNLLVIERDVQVLLEDLDTLVDGIGQADQSVQVLGEVPVAKELLALLVDEELELLAPHLRLPRQRLRVAVELEFELEGVADRGGHVLAGGGLGEGQRLLGVRVGCCFRRGTAGGWEGRA